MLSCVFAVAQKLTCEHPPEAVNRLLRILPPQIRAGLVTCHFSLTTSHFSSLHLRGQALHFSLLPVFPSARSTPRGFWRRIPASALRCRRLRWRYPGSIRFPLLFYPNLPAPGSPHLGENKPLYLNPCEKSIFQSACSILIPPQNPFWRFSGVFVAGARQNRIVDSNKAVLR